MTSKQKDERKAVLGKRYGRSLIGCALFAFLITLLFCGAALFIAAFILSRFPAFNAYIGAVGSILGALAALLGGFFAGKRHKLSGALAGLLFGVFYTAALLLIGRLCGGSASLPTRLLGNAVFLLLATLGGALGTVQVGRRPRRKRRR